jgi:hypothetical protein
MFKSGLRFFIDVTFVNLSAFEPSGQTLEYLWIFPGVVVVHNVIHCIKHILSIWI